MGGPFRPRRWLGLSGCPCMWCYLGFDGVHAGVSNLGCLLAWDDAFSHRRAHRSACMCVCRFTQAAPWPKAACGRIPNLRLFLLQVESVGRSPEHSLYPTLEGG